MSRLARDYAACIHKVWMKTLTKFRLLTLLDLSARAFIKNHILLVHILLYGHQRKKPCL